MQPPLGIVVCHRLRNLWFRKKANYFCGAAPEKMVPISSAASLLFCFFLPSFLPQHLDCSISHWIILGRTSEEGASEASGGEIKQPLADPTRLRLWWGNGGKRRRRKSRQSLLLSERLSDATMARRHGYYAILRRHLNTLAQGESLTQGKSKLAFPSPNSVVCSVCPSARSLSLLHGWVISFPRLSKTKRRLSDRSHRRRVNSFHPLSLSV